MESLHSKGAEIAFSKLSQNLDEYICSAETNDEQTYCELFIHKECPMAFVQHQPLSGGFNVYRSRMGNSIGADEDITNPSIFFMYHKINVRLHFLHYRDVIFPGRAFSMPQCLLRQTLRK